MPVRCPTDGWAWVVAVGFAAAVASSGCVSRVRYDACLADGARARADADSLQRQLSSQLGAAQQQRVEAQAEIQERDARLNDLSTAMHNTQLQLDQSTAISQQLRGELQRLGTDVDKMLAERGTLTKALDDARSRLEELRKAQAVAETRAQLLRDLQQRFKPLIDAGQLRLETRRGELVIEVPGDLLFDESGTDFRAAGKGALMEIARALQITSPPSTGRRFLVTADLDAHADAEKIDKSKGDRSKGARKTKTSDWDVTATRAVAVVEFLVTVGVPSGSLTAAAGGSSDPLVANDTAQNRQKNRRVEIAILALPPNSAP